MPRGRGRPGGRVGGANGPTDRGRRKLDELALDALRFEGPGTDLTVGCSLRATGTARGSRPSTASCTPPTSRPRRCSPPRPVRVEGYAARLSRCSSRGCMITGLRVGSRAGPRSRSTPTRARTRCATCPSAIRAGARLGEVALVDRDSRVGDLDTVFFDTLLDENAASHIALGEGLDFAVLDERRSGADQPQRAPHRPDDRLERGRGHGRRSAAAPRLRCSGTAPG